MKVILTCAVTGAHTTKKQNPNLPVTPKEIAESAISAAHAGASVVHIHVRDPITGAPSMDLDLYREVVDRIRSGCDALINLTTGPGSTVSLDRLHERRSAEDRVAHIQELRPEICSLDFNTMNRGLDKITINDIATIKTMAKLIDQAGVLPELEIFDGGDMMIARDLINDGTIKSPALIQIATGVKWGWPSTPETLAFARSLLPHGSTWYAFGVGQWQMPFVALSSISGGHARVGLEDNIFISRRVLAESNSQLVTKARRIIEDLGKELASPGETRDILGISVDKQS